MTMMMTTHRFVRFLASVTSEAEARIAAAHGADIIDCKNPSEGALGALPHSVVAAIRRAVPRQVPVSATIGDLPADPERVTQAARAMAASGCDIVKIGFFPGGDAGETIRRLGREIAAETRLVAVLLADAPLAPGIVSALEAAGFEGVMLDTAAKDGRTLLDHRSLDELGTFINEAHAAGLFAGLAGALSAAQIPGLAALGPDILGFRGALCRGRDRTRALDPDAVAAVRDALAAATPTPAAEAGRPRASAAREPAA